MDVCSVLLRLTTTMLSSVNKEVFIYTTWQDLVTMRPLCAMRQKQMCIFCQVKHHKVRQLNALKPYHYEFPSIDEENHKTLPFRGFLQTSHMSQKHSKMCEKDSGMKERGM